MYSNVHTVQPEYTVDHLRSIQLTSQPLAQIQLGCEVGWLDAGSTNMGCLYFESITKRKPDQALRFCEERSAHLVETINQAQLDFVRMQLQVIEEQQGTAINWWGGAVDENRNGNWMWPNSKVSLGDFIFHLLLLAYVENSCSRFNIVHVKYVHGNKQK